MRSFRALFVISQMPGLTWYRAKSFVPHMNIDSAFYPEYYPDKVPNWEERLLKDKSVLYEIEKEVARSDIVIYQRVRTCLSFSTILGMREKHGKKSLVEIDDDVFNVDSSNPGYQSVNPNSESEWWFKKQLEESNGVITTTEYLKNLYKKHNKKVHIIKNSIDTDYWNKLKKPKPHKGIRIGWQGAAHHYADLQVISSIIPKVLRRYKNVEFWFFGSKFDYLDQKGCKFFEMVPIDRYHKQIINYDFDIILAPLKDTPFNRGKSNIRVLEAGAMKKPCIASANKHLPYAKTIENGKDGFLCETEADWMEAIDILINDEVKRKELGQNLYGKIEKDYNIKDTAKEYERLLRNFK